MTKKRKTYRIRKDQPHGNRSASGRKRDRTPERATACDGLMRKRAEYGFADNDADYADAIGRAHIAGLLGTGDRAKDMVVAARKIAWQYWRVFRPEFGTPDSLARFQPQAPTGRPDPERERILEDAMNDSLDSIGKAGRNVRTAFDQLVIDMNPDHGPAWLDRVIFARRSGKSADNGDWQRLEWALEGLRVIT